jgi:hypothetical protein
MKTRNYLFLIVSIVLHGVVASQDLQSKVTVVASRVPNTVDKKVFQTLQTQLTNFINNRKWSQDVVQPQERIQCSFLLNIESEVETNVYKASLTIQAARPVFNSSYSTALINFQDPELTFRYIEYQPVEFNENRVQGSDALAGNLTATFAYYINIIMGLDYDSFGPKGGDLYFQKAQNIVNNAPENRNISGWKAFDGARNRYWLAENLLNNRFNLVHDIIYSYYRQGLDFMYENETDARSKILNALIQLQALNQDNPNSMIVQFFMIGKSMELIQIFKKSPPQDKLRALEVLQKLDVANASKYQQELK